MTPDHDSTLLVGHQPAFPDPLPRIIPFGAVTLLGGAPGVGKTALLADWLVRFRDGKTIFGFPTNPPPGGIFYLASDRGWRSARHWFALVDYTNIPHYSLTNDPKLNLDDLKDWKASILLDKCLSHLNPPPGALLVLDPLAPLFIAGDPNRTRDVARSLILLGRLCEHRQITIIATCHFGKQKVDSKDRYTRPQDRIAGSTSFAGFTDTQIYLLGPEPPEYPQYRVGWVPHEAPPAEFDLQRDDRGLFVPVTLTDFLDSNADRVYRHLPAAGYEPLGLDVLLLKAGLPRRTLQRALTDLVNDGRAERVRPGYYRKRKPQ
jgi:hypothetical protein